jgi:nucleoside-diphosphate-sugar epimerase
MTGASCNRHIHTAVNFRVVQKGHRRAKRRDPIIRQGTPSLDTDPVHPEEAYPASKIAAETALRESGLNWSTLRFPFVYGDGDGHLAMLPRHVAAFGFHPANRMSTVHHRDIATAIQLALAGAFDGRIVNIADEAPTTIYELVGLGSETMVPSCEPMPIPGTFISTRPYRAVLVFNRQ